MGDDMPGDRLPEQDCRLAIRVSGLVMRHAVFQMLGYIIHFLQIA